MVCGPTDNAEVMRLATPFWSKLMVSSTTDPSWKVNVPVGVPPVPELDVTVAVKVISSPAVGCLSDEVKATAVGASGGGTTCWLKVVDELAAKFVSPLYDA